MAVKLHPLPITELKDHFGLALRENEALARYTSSRIGGPADALIEVHSAEELSQVAAKLWELGLPFMLLGGGSNVLVSDEGVREVVILNHARKVQFRDDGVWAESGASLGVIARQAARKGLSGLEWAAGIPGTLGGAVVGNAGAHGGDMAAVLSMAEILHQEKGRQKLSTEDLEFGYRQSWLKFHTDEALLLSADLRLTPAKEAAIKEKMDSFLSYRRLTQPPGASMGSMFKNPPDDHAGRLIEAAGLKGKRVGDAQISPLHANFFLNLGEAKAADVHALIKEAQSQVSAQFGVELELEIGLVGEW